MATNNRRISDKEMAQHKLEEAFKKLADNTDDEAIRIKLAKDKKTLEAMLNIEHNDAAHVVAEEILHKDDLQELANIYFYQFLCRAFINGGSSRGSTASSASGSGVSTPRGTKFRKAIQERDENRCAYSGSYSWEQSYDDGVLVNDKAYGRFKPVGPLETVHIIGHCTKSDSNRDFWKLLQNFGMQDLAECSLIDRAENGFLLFSGLLHKSYDRAMWYIEVDETDPSDFKYYVRFLDESMIDNDYYYRWYLNDDINFSTKITERAPREAYKLRPITYSGEGRLHINGTAANRPCPKLLKLRELLSKVLRASGRANEISEMERDMDEDPQLGQTANNPEFLDEVAKRLVRFDREQTMVDMLE
ncbi:hypothetical protein HDV05_000872 [Chytridiales sp. JEL 0842]|nr:hypothetical protein HDV05_000872 [Chytridiales sp. JEL 0842]